MGVILLLGLSVYSFINIKTGGLVFLITASVFNLYILLTQFSGISRNINLEKLDLNHDEIRILKKYHLYFRYPFASRIFSSFASGIYIIGGVVAIWLLVHKLWLPGALLALNALIATVLSSKLNPVFLLHDAVEKRGKHELRDEMLLVDSVSNKIFKS